MRSDLTFPSGGARCATWLYTPAGSSLPCVVMAHGFGATRAGRLDAYAERFAAAGFAVLVFDYRHFGDSEGSPRQLLDIARQHDDWRAAIAFARTLPAVDAERIAVWGTSFSGGHVAVLAAEDPRLAAAVSQVPFIDGIATLWALGLRSNLQLTAAGLRDEWARLRRRPPAMLPIVGPPGTAAAMSTPDSLPGYSALYPDGVDWVNEVAGRVALRVGFYRPGRRASEIACPWLVQVAVDDAITPAPAALAAAARAPWAAALKYEGGHFDVYRGETFERVVGDQVSFLRRVLTTVPEAVAA